MLGSWLHRRSEWFLHAATAIGFGGRRALAGWIMYGLRCPVSWLPPLAGFGPFTHRDEYASILDNFFEGALRFEPLERHVSSTTNALVLDVGVNVGITVRWWLHLNPHAQVIAVDMIREANEFSARALAAVNPAYPAQVRYVEAVVGETSGSMEISFDDPLAGTNSTRARATAPRGARSPRGRSMTSGSRRAVATSPCSRLTSRARRARRSPVHRRCCAARSLSSRNGTTPRSSPG